MNVRAAGRAVAGVPLWTWAASTVVAVAMMGPGLGRGALLNLDLVVVDDTPVPRGMWGLGPELPRRVPLYGPIAWLSHVIGGEFVVKTLMTASMVVAAAGLYRLVARHTSVLPATAGAALYAFGPFFLTRLAVGQLAVVLVMALLPWALPALLTPSANVRRLVVWSAALGVGGVYGGIVAGAVIAVVLTRERARRVGAVMGAFAVGQLPWLAALTIVTLTTPSTAIASAAFFRPPVANIGDVGRLLAGMGFWNLPFQIGKDQPVLTAALGFVLFALAVAGVRDLPDEWRVPLTVVGGAALALSLWSGLPHLDSTFDRFADTAVGAPFRETQRFLLPYVLWLAVAAPIGARRVALRWPDTAVASTVAVVPLAAALALAGPGLWGLGGQLDPAVFPPEWHTARAAIDREPGTVLALPWYQYFTLDIAHDHLVLNVVPYFLGGDVLAASDPNLSRGREQEVPDPRELAMDPIVADGRNGGRLSDRVLALGVRWIALQHDVDWELYTGIPTDPGLERVVTGSTLDLYRVRAWRGPVVTPDGVEVGSSSVVAPVRRVASSGPATYLAPYQSGWLRGWSTTTETREGLIALAAGRGLVWFWPAVVVVGADAVTLCVVAVCVLRPIRRRTTGLQMSRADREVLDESGTDQ